MRNFTKSNLFGEGGTFRELPKNEQRELLGSVLTVLETETQEFIDEVTHGRRDGIDWDDANLRPRLKHLADATENGVFLPDWKERVALIEEATHYYYSNYSGRAIRNNRELIQEAAARIEKFLGEVPEGLTGKGLEFAPSSIGEGKKIYMDGQYITSVVNARFNDSPTDGRIVAWLTVEQIDHCSFRGAQTSWKVFAWKKGLEEPKQIFEDHAYNAERMLSVDAPKVSKDSKVTVSISVNGKRSTREISLVD